ncbi:methyl-accepting chemotaxis protein [Maribrevibacterium harenarium]|nr:methyl-accepting chemotaxis protein [Maribrevibacterium harenarium]
MSALRLKVSHAIALVGFLPVLLALVLAGLLINGQLAEIRQGERAQDMVKLSGYLDSVAHNHAVERGLSAGFLGSKGVNGKEAMLKQRGVADESAQRLRALTAADFDQLTDAELEALVDPVLRLLDGKKQVRNKIDQLAPDNGAFAYYSKLNATALSSIKYLITDISDVDLAHMLNARLSLQWMKERIGQYRGALNGVFAAKSVSPQRYTEILGYLSDETRRLQDFRAFASTASLAELDQAMKASEWQAVDTHVLAFSQAKDLSAINGPENWFAIATKRIGLVKGVADNIGDRVAQSAMANVDASKQRMTLLLVLLFVVTVPVLWLIRSVIRSVASRVELIHNVLRAIAKDRDLTQKIPNTADDEVGEIITALNEHLVHLSKSFSLLYDLSEQSRDSMQSLFGRAQAALAETKDQFNRTDQIASAVEEMSLTSNTISEDMVSLAKETEQIQQQGNQGRDRMDNILGSISSLSHEVEGGFQAVQQVTDQTEQISSILQTIESIAEQTNLLALNAAIEAARAGEQGRGFAVVADEVRSLAQRTQDSTEEIRTMIESLVRSGQSALTSMDRCSKMATDTSGVVNQNVEMMRSLFASIDTINQTIERVATASEEQSQVSEDINRNVQTVNERSHHILDAVTDTETGTEQAMKRFDQVLHEVSSYKIR